MNVRSLPTSGGIVTLFTRHPNAANLVMILMIIFGVASLSRINTQFFPTLEVKTVSVSVSWSGASAEDISANVLQVIEPEIRFLEGVQEIASYAREGSGTIALEFKPETDMQKAAADVDAAVKAISNLPEDADTPKVSQNAFFDRVARLAIIGDVPEATLRIYAKKIRDDLVERGIDKVSFSGMRKEELQVEIPEEELRRLGMSIGEISSKISNNSRDLPSGQTEGTVERQIRALADVKNPAKLGELEIKAFPTGEKVQLKDIATIKTGYDKDEERGLSGGKRAIQITVERAPSADTLVTAAILDDYLEAVEPLLPPGIELKKYEVRADSLVARIWLLVSNGISGLVLVVATLFIFLNARIAFWVAAGIPVAMLTAVGILFLMGQSINMISLFGLIMMLGIIVDDAIVVGEHTATRFTAGDGPFEAAENGAGRMVKPVIAALLTTVASFTPILLIGDVIGQIMGVLPIVVIATAMASLLECFLVLPGHLAHSLSNTHTRAWSYKRQFVFGLVIGILIIALISRGSGWEGNLVLSMFSGVLKNYSLPAFIALLAITSLAASVLIEGMIYWVANRKSATTKVEFERESFEQENGFRVWFDRKFNAFRDGPFSALVSLSFRWRYVTVSVAFATVLLATMGLMGGEHVKFIFFPSPESENMRARAVFNAGIPEARAIEILGEIEDSLYETVDQLTDGKEELVTAVFATLGKAGRSTGDNLAEIRVQLTSSEIRSIRTSEIVKAWRDNLPNMAGVRRVSVYAPRGGPPGRDVEIELTNSRDDMLALKRASTEIIEIVKALDGVSGVDDDLAYGKPELVMKLLPRGAALGFSIDQVGQQIRDAFDGAVPRKFAKGDDEVSIRVTMTSDKPGNAFLREFELKTADGQFVPLRDVVSLEEQQGFSAIQRENGRAIVKVTADLDNKELTTDEAIEKLNASPLAEVVAKHGLQYRFGGRDEERKKAFVDLRLGVILALCAIYMILAWVFSSYSRPVAIMLIIPFGLVGAIFGHWLLGYNLTILSLIGLLGLAGILVNDSIVLVSRMDERLDEGEYLDEAVTGASRDRLRAVLLTSLTTIGGLVPLMFEKNVQAQFLLPMAITIVFGLALATLLVLFLVPAFIGIGHDIQRVLQYAFGAKRASHV